MPKKGLEPPRPCGHMDLNHARLPIPPLRHEGTAAVTSRSRGKDYVTIFAEALSAVKRKARLTIRCRDGA